MTVTGPDFVALQVRDLEASVSAAGRPGSIYAWCQSSERLARRSRSTAAVAYGVSCGTAARGHGLRPR
jgi:hypothetical protein